MPQDNPVTYEDYVEAYKALVAQGRNPSQRAIRDHLGRGSPNTIMKHAQSFALESNQDPLPNAIREARRKIEEIQTERSALLARLAKLDHEEKRARAIEVDYYRRYEDLLDENGVLEVYDEH